MELLGALEALVIPPSDPLAWHLHEQLERDTHKLSAPAYGALLTFCFSERWMAKVS